MTLDDIPSEEEFEAVRAFLARLSPSEMNELKDSLAEAVAELNGTGGTPLDFQEIKRKAREYAAARRDAS